MSAKWKWNTVNIYVNQYEINREVKRAEIFKLDNTESSFHYFGAGSKKMSVKGLVVGETDRAAIESDAINNVQRNVTTPWGSILDCRINGIPKFRAIDYVGGTIDGVSYSASTTPLFNVEMEIIQA